jgi:tight adherence protein C
VNQILVPILVFISVGAIGAALLTWRAARLQRLRLRMEEFGPIAAHADMTGGKPTSGLWNLFEQIGAKFSSKDDASEMQKSMAQAGFFSPTAASVYLGVRLIALIVGVTIAGAIVLPLGYATMVKLSIIIGSGWVVSLIPSIYVDICRSKRTKQIRHHLPDAVDMLEICVSSGMGLDMAWNSVAEEIRRVSTILADEMALTNLEIHLGAGRAEAMRHMADRTGSEDLNSLVSTLVQSERFGTAISDSLKTFAGTMREIRMTRAAEAAEKMGIKMLFPMIGFILPAILIVMGGGAIIKIMDMFKSM